MQIRENISKRLAFDLNQHVVLGFGMLYIPQQPPHRQRGLLIDIKKAFSPYREPDRISFGFIHLLHSCQDAFIAAHGADACRFVRLSIHQAFRDQPDTQQPFIGALHGVQLAADPVLSRHLGDGSGIGAVHRLHVCF
ncbi:hypothetical protein D3C75_748470 [compost metagenome]